MRARFSYFLILLGALGWCLLLIVPPVVASVGQGFAEPLYSVFSLICHQDDARSFHLSGFKWAVCSRCVAIYFGFLMAVVAKPLLTRRRFVSRPILLWAVALTPMILDVLLGVVGIHTVTTFTRISTGVWFGSIAGSILVPYLTHAIDETVLYLLHSQRNRAYATKTR